MDTITNKVETFLTSSADKPAHSDSTTDTNAVQTLVTTSIIAASPDKFYHFFKFTINDLVKVVPLVFTSVHFVEGEEGKVGNIRIWKYKLAGLVLTAKVKLAELDDTARSLTFTVMEGDLLTLYKSFSVKLEFSEGSAKGTIIYEKKTLLSPPPQAYIAILHAVLTLLDVYLHI